LGPSADLDAVAKRKNPDPSARSLITVLSYAGSLYKEYKLRMPSL